MYTFMRKPTQEEIQSAKYRTAVATIVRVGKVKEFYPAFSSKDCSEYYWEDPRVVYLEELVYYNFPNTMDGWLEYAKYNILADDDETEIMH